jgi:hypothetical protein
MATLEGSGVPVLYIGRTVPIGQAVSITCHNIVLRIRDKRWRWCESSVPPALAVDCQAVRLSQVVKQERRVL